MNDAETLKNQGNALRGAGDLQGAADAYRRALDARPGYPPALYNLGITLRDLGELEEAEGCFRRLLEREPGDVETLFNLGALLRRQARLEEADAVLRAASERDPGNAHVLLFLGHVGLERFTTQSLADAARFVRRAIELNPALHEAHNLLGEVLAADDKADQALPALAEAHRLAPQNAGYAAALLTQKQRICDWTGLEELQDALRAGAVRADGEMVPPFALLTVPSTAEQQLACARKHADALWEAGRQARAKLSFRFDRPVAPRMRIGYLSAEFHSHATAYLAAELFELHDRGRVELFAYSYGPDDGSAMRRRLERAFDRFIDLRRASDPDAASTIHRDGIEILVDLKGYTFRGRPGILALRPAPVQVSFLGYPGTMGAQFIDYLVGDAFVTPAGAEGGYSEKLVRMPQCYQPNDRRRTIGAPLLRRELGLPEDGFVFACFNQSYKILPEVFAAWMRLLADVPRSVLWLLEWNAPALHNLRAQAARHGIDPGRLVFSPLAPLDVHLSRMRNADLFLDTFPVTAHTTASEAIWAGLPLLTRVGETFISRVAGSLLHACDVGELAVASLAEYEHAARWLARDPGALAGLRARLERAKGEAALFDTPRYVRDLEDAFDRIRQPG